MVESAADEVDEEVKALLIRASRAKAEAVLSPKRREVSEVPAATEEMRALQDKIRRSRANAEALIAQRARRQEENENCSNLKELQRVKRRAEKKNRREASLEEKEARDLEKVTQKLAKQRVGTEDESAAPEDRDQTETSTEEEEVRTRVAVDEVVKAEEKRKLEEAKVVAELERAIAVAEGVQAEEKRKSEEAKAAAELERVRVAVDEVLKAKEKRKSEEAKEAKVAAELERARLAVEVARRRKKEAKAIAEKLSLEKANEMTKHKEQQRKKEEVAALVGKVLNVYKNGKNSLYNVLGISPSASEAEIKKAYRKLALKLHPDKDRHSTASIDEAFNAVTDAYETLRDDARRREYDLLQDGGVPPPAPATPDPLSFGTIPVGASVTIQSNYDARFPHLAGMKGSVLNFDPSSNLYTVKLDNSAVILSDASALFQNVIVCLRAHAASQLGVFLVTLASYWDEAGSYQASYCPGGGVKKMTTLRPEQFIIPNGTAVRLPGRGDTYGTVVDWKERSDDRGNDASCYEVRLSSTVSVHVKMADVCL